MAREVLDSFERLAGQEVAAVHQGDEWVDIRFTNGFKACFYHDQDCCERVRLEDVIGDLQSLVGKTIASVAKSYDEPESEEDRRYYDDSHTWSVFTIETTDGTTVVMEWLGESNGYYSEDVYVSFE